MLKLQKLCSVINRNMKVDLISEDRNDAYYYGNVRNRPKQYDSWEVVDLIKHSDYECTIIIKK